MAAARKGRGAHFERARAELERLGAEAAEKHCRRWTPAEDKVLRESWGEFNIETIAKRVKRTMEAVEGRAAALGLGGKRHGLVSVAQIARETGYDSSTIKIAIEALGLNFPPIPVISASQHKKRRNKRGRAAERARRGIDEDDVARLVEYLTARNVRDVMVRPGLRRYPAHLWGVGERPPACVRCQRTDRPHYGKGLCKSCHGHGRRHFRVAWGAGCWPDRCPVCKTADSPPYAKGMCQRCYDKQRRARAKERGSDARQAAE